MEYVQLTEPERSFWLSEQVAGGHNHVAVAFDIGWQHDTALLAAAFRQLVAEQPRLRCRIVTHDGYACWHDDAAAAPPALGTVSCDAGDVEATLWRLARRPFCLEREAPCRAVLVSGGGRQLLLVVVHHVATEVGSMALLCARLSDLYGMLASGARLQDAEHVPLMPLLLPATTQQDVDFWADYVARHEGQPLLPWFTPSQRAGIVTPQRFALGTLAGRLAEVCQHEGVGPWRLLAAAWGLTLLKVFGTEGVWLNYPVSLRPEAHQATMATFVADQLLHVGVEGLQRFDQLVRRVADHRRASRSHQHASLLQTAVGGVVRSATACALLNFPLNRRDYVLTLDGERIPLYHDYTTYMPCGIQLDVEGDLSFGIVYTDESYPGFFARMLADALVHVLGQVVADVHRPLDSLTLCPQTDTWNREVRPLSDNSAWLAHNFRLSAQRNADSTAVVCGADTLSYTQLDRWSDSVARLIMREVGQGQPAPETAAARSNFVGVYLSRGVHTPAVLLGVWKAGYAYIPLDPENPPQRMEHILTDSRPALVVSDTDQVPFKTERLLVVGRRQPAEADSQQPLLLPPPSPYAYMMYTSGTTGQPKGTPVSQLSVVSFLGAVADHARVEPGCRQLCFNSVAFDLSVWDMFAPLMAGATVVMATETERHDPRLLLQLMDSQRVSHAIVAPAMMSCVPYQPLPHLRCLVLSGEASPLDTVRRWLPVGTVLNGYGPTENTIVCCIHRYADADDCATNIGQALRGTTCYVLDEQHRQLPVGVKGQLYVGGLQLTEGYHRRPELNSERFMANPFATDGERACGQNLRLYATGDVAYRLPSGDIVYCGRCDSQVKINGHRIELGETAACIEQMEGVTMATVMVDERGGARRLHAFVETASGQLDRRALRRWLESRLPLFMVPSGYTLVERMPMNINRKVDAAALRALLDSSSADTTDSTDTTTDIYTAIATEGGPLEGTRRQLADIWSGLLGENTHYGLDDNFLSLGGDSVAIIVMVQHIERLMGTTMAVADVYQAATIRQLAQLIGPVVPQRQQHRDMLALTATMAMPPHLHSLLLQCSMSPQASAAYNLALLMPLPDGADDGLLLQAWNMLRQMQDALRLGVARGGDGRPQMAVAPYEACSSLPQHYYADEAALRQMVYDALAVPYDFDGQPLCRLVLCRRQDGQDGRLVLFIHHLATDGWSLQLVRRQLAAVCQALHDRQPELLPLPLHTYREYALTMAQRTTTQQCRDYWADYLSDFEDVRLPYTAANGQDVRQAATLAMPLGSTMADAVARYCEHHRLTPFAFYMAAYSVVLARICRQTGFVVGYPSAGRGDARFADVMGYFVHPLPLRLDDAAWGMTFAQLCRHIMDDVVQAEQHLADFASLAEIAAKQGHTDPAMSLIQAMFTLDDQSAGQVLDNAALAQFPLTLTVAIGADSQWACSWKYATARLASDDVALMARCYLMLIDNILGQKNVDQPVARLTMVDSEERQQLLRRNTIWPLTTPRETIVSLFASQVRRSPHPWMLKDRHGTMTYAEADRRSDLLACMLQDLSATATATVKDLAGRPLQGVTGMYMNRSAQAVVAMIGIMKAGHMYVPLDTTYPAARIRAMVADSQMGCVVCQRELLPQLRDMQLPNEVSIVCYDDVVDGTLYRCPADPQLTPSTPAYMIYTSGTTGQPKGVVITHGNVASLARIGGQGRCNPVADDIVLQFNSYIFDASINDVFASLLNGARLVCIDEEGRRDPDLLFRQMEQSGVTYACIPPALLLNSDHEPTTALRTLLCGGETPSPVVVERYTRSGTMLNGYGPSENTVVATINDYRQSRIFTANCIGRQLPGVSCYVLDDHLNLVPPGCPGQLFLGGLQLSPGYHNRPELNSRHFVDNPYVSPEDKAHGQNLRIYATGDIVRQDTDGNLYFLGRKDFQVKLRGYRVELSEIEGTLMRHDSVRQCVVMVAKRGVADQLAAYVAYDGDKPTPRQLRDFAARSLPAYMVPDHWYVAPQLPLTVNGKTDRRRLASLPLTAVAAATADSSLSEEEAKCRAVVARIMAMDISAIGADDDLIADVGMNSLFVLELVHQLRSRGYDLHPMDIYNLRTVRQLVRYMDSPPQLTSQQTDARLCYMATPDDPAKPLLLVVCGYRYYEVNYGDLHRALKDHYTLLVIESALELQSRRPERAATAQAMLDEYVRLLRPWLQHRPLAGITGLCIGGDIGLQLAVRLQQQGLGCPAVFVIDGMADRPAYRGNTGIMEGAGIDLETDQQRKDYIIAFSKTLHQHRYAGPVYLFMATRFESVEQFTADEARRFFPHNRDNWQRLQPDIKISYYDAVHMQLIHNPATLAQMKRIIDDELLR